MNAATKPGGHALVELDLRPDRSLAARQLTAWRDLCDGMALWRLCLTLAWLDIRQRYRGSMLGPFWLTLSTLIMVAAMGVIYATLFHVDVHSYLPFLALSLVLWNYLSVLVSEGCTTYTAAEGVIRSVRMPYTLYAGRIVVRNVIVLAHNVVVVVGVDLVKWAWPGVSALASLPALLIWAVDSLAIAVLLGALCARFRDIGPIVASVMQMAFLVSAVIWPPAQLGTSEWLLVFNPFYPLLEIVRAPLLGHIPGVWVYASAVLYSTLLCLAAWFLFVRVRGRIAFWV